MVAISQISGDPRSTAQRMGLRRRRFQHDRVVWLVEKATDLLHHGLRIFQQPFIAHLEVRAGRPRSARSLPSSNIRFPTEGSRDKIAFKRHAIVEARGQHPHWGPVKLRAWLQRTEPEIDWPAASTMGEILRRHGLAVPRKKRLQTPANTQPFTACART